MDALLAFGGALVSLRLAAALLLRHRRRRAPELAAWAASLAAFAVASAALAWGAAAGWSEAPFRVYYLCGGLLTAALLGAGSLLRVGARWAGPAALVYAGLAAGVAVAAPLTAPVSGTGIPAAQDHLELFPARALAIAGNSAGTLAAVGVALWTIRARPLGNALVVAGVAVAALGSALAGLGEAGTALFSLAAALLLAAGFLAPSRAPLLAQLRRPAALRAGTAALAQPDAGEEADDRERDRPFRDRAVEPAVRDDHPRESSQRPPTV